MTSHPEFNERTTGTEVARVFADQIRGKTILITGISPKGIGASTALAFASQAPALLILASRTKSKLEAVADQIRHNFPHHTNTRIELVSLDLSSQSSIRQAVTEITRLTNNSKLDILINNAAINTTTRQTTPEGLEITFGTNHIGTFLFTNLLLPLLLRNNLPSPPPARIITVSSAGHRLSPIRFSDYNFSSHPEKAVPPEEDYMHPLPGAFAKCTADGYNGMVTYGQSKTANILFTLYLQRQLKGRGVGAYTLHPGTIETELGRDQDPEVKEEFHKIEAYWKSLDEGCATTMVAALDPALDETKGLYLVDCQVSDPHPHAKDEVAAERLWKLSEEIVGEKFTLEDF